MTPATIPIPRLSAPTRSTRILRISASGGASESDGDWANAIVRTRIRLIARAKVLSKFIVVLDYAHFIRSLGKPGIQIDRSITPIFADYDIASPRSDSQKAVTWRHYRSNSEYVPVDKSRLPLNQFVRSGVY